MILILERSFRYQGKYVSVKQIEDAAVYYTTAMTKTFSGKEVLLQQHVHDEVDRLIPLKKVSVGWRFAKLRSGLQDIVYMNRFDRKVDGPRSSISPSEASKIPELDTPTEAVELDANPREPQEVEGDTIRSPIELDSAAPTLVQTPSTATTASPTPTRKFSWMDSKTSTPTVEEPPKAWAVAELDGKSADIGDVKKAKSDGSSNLFKRSLTKLTLKKTKSSGAA